LQADAALQKLAKKYALQNQSLKSHFKAGNIFEVLGNPRQRLPGGAGIKP